MEELRVQLEMLMKYQEYYQKRWGDWGDLRARMKYFSMALSKYYRDHGLGMMDLISDMQGNGNYFKVRMYFDIEVEL